MSHISAESKEYSRNLLVFGNLAIALWIVLGAVACWSFSSLVGWLFLVSALVAVFGILRKLGCNSCYYCKSCTMGFGKLADLFFGEGYMAGVKSSRLLKLVFVYGLLGIVPTVFLAVSIMQELVAFKIAVLVPLLLLIVYSGFRKKPQ
ncbi:MAG: hypothetical protein NWE94_04470 [Candidatus Bathyarchaeota archaeon]|nr:hypothetical protein [Candidatus Bathyarchaeota archaeon]